MLAAPPATVGRIAGLPRDAYGVEAARVSFLPIGGDANARVYRVTGPEGSAYFLRLRLGYFDSGSVVEMAHRSYLGRDRA